MKEEKKVAICLSTYNGEKYIEEQLESLLHQTYSNIEIYVRDDSSSDKTKKILQKYASKITIITRREYRNCKKFYGTINLYQRGRLLCFLRPR